MAAAAASTSMAATAVFASRFPLCSTTKAGPARCSALPYLPPRLSATAFSSSLKFADEGIYVIYLQDVTLQLEVTLVWHNIVFTLTQYFLRGLMSNMRKGTSHGYYHVISKNTASGFPKEPKRSSLLQVKASSSEESGAVDTSELLTDLKEKWDALDNKSTVLIYGGGGIVAVWLSTIVVGAINSVPLLPKIMELVGLGYTGWFVYRYLLFKSNRKELAEDIEQLKKKIAGTE